MKLLDKDGSGLIDKHELLAALGDSEVSEEAVLEFIRRYDKDGDGKLDAEELTKFLEECDYWFIKYNL